MEAIRRDAPDLVLMDIQMPVLDGYAATRQIRQWEATASRPHLPIIALTANAYEEDRRRCMDAGMDDFLAKPISVDLLKAVLDRWLPKTAAAPLASEVAKKGDIPGLLALIDEITPLLAQSRFDAVTRFNALKSLATGTGWEKEINEIGGLVASLRFDLAINRLHHLGMAMQAPENMT